MNKELIKVKPIINIEVRKLCVKPYYKHPKGCPNFGNKHTCPPKLPLFSDIYDIKQPVYAVVNEFNLEEHVKKLKEKHPNWSERQLFCCLYWQQTARKHMKEKVLNLFDNVKFLKKLNYHIITCPEGMGVDVTNTLATVGINLEWPPKHIARQVVLLARYI